MKHSQALEVFKASAKNENDELQSTIIKLHEERLAQIEVHIKDTYKLELIGMKNDMQELDKLIRQSHRVLKKEIQITWWERVIIKIKGER